jgi:C-terminal processing protease CtpA/Prc
MELECNSSGEWFVAAVRPGGPADLSRVVKPGDVVVSVEWCQIKVSHFTICSCFAIFDNALAYAQGRSENEVNKLLFGSEGTTVTIEAVSPRGERRHATMVRVRADLDPPSVTLNEEKSWGVLCCKT